ncbi:hypothetical protein ACA910_020984 [Epithemia clementina (nom. ined.)]
MKFTVATTAMLFAAASLLDTSQAFSIAPRNSQSIMSTTKLFTSSTHISKDYLAGSGMNEHHIPVLIQNLTPENFDESLEMLEPLLTNECIGESCDMYLNDLNVKAKEIGKTVPEGFAPSHH